MTPVSLPTSSLVAALDAFGLYSSLSPSTLEGVVKKLLGVTSLPSTVTCAQSDWWEAVPVGTLGTPRLYLVLEGSVDAWRGRIRLAVRGPVTSWVSPRRWGAPRPCPWSTGRGRGPSSSS